MRLTQGGEFTKVLLTTDLSAFPSQSTKGLEHLFLHYYYINVSEMEVAINII